MRETELYEPVRRWLEGQGYTVSAEVHHCDIVARDPREPEDLIVVELKTRMSLDLIMQAALRKEITDSVYVAVPLHGSRAGLRNARALKNLLRRLELGLIVIRYVRSGVRLEVQSHPAPFTARTAHRRRTRIVREIDGRYAEFDAAGHPGNAPRMSAWRQRSLLVASLLRDRETASPLELRRRGAPAETQRILAVNSYGWFERIRRGRYSLTGAGRTALEKAPHAILQHLGEDRRGAT